MGLPARLKRLPFGDVAFRGTSPAGFVLVGLEIKRLGDFISSFLSARFQDHQLPGLQASYRVCWLVLEGEYREGRNGSLEVPIKEHWKGPGCWRLWKTAYGGLSFTALEGALLTFVECAGLRLQRTRSADETASFVAALYRWWQKDSHHAHEGKHSALWTSDWYALNQRRRSFAERVARELPGVDRRAASVVAHFRTVQAMVEAPISEWRRVKGIGRTLAGKAWRAWRQES